MAKINFSQILFILLTLPVNKSFIIKTFLPQVHPSNISLNNILYDSFKELYFYKPMQNKHSGEFYIIGKGYCGISKKLEDKLIEFHKNFKYDKYIYNIENKFLFTYEKAINNIIENCSEAIERKSIFYANYDILSKYEDYYKKLQVKKCNEWINKFGIKKIKGKYLL